MLDLTRRALNRVYDAALESLCYGASPGDLHAEVDAAIKEARRYAEQVEGETAAPSTSA